jgi:hypothetical protein
MLALDILYPIIVPLGLIVADRSDVEKTNVIIEAHPEATISFILFEFIFV